MSVERDEADGNAAAARRLVDPETLGLIEGQPIVDIAPENLPAVRAASALPWPAAPSRGAVDVVRHEAPGLDGGPAVPVLLFRPETPRDRHGCILHIHGGAYVAGSAAAMEPTNRHRAAELGCTIVSVDYRLAPETAFPGALHDCHAALRWARGQAAALGLDGARVGVMGESAGGGLAAALALLVRDRGEPALAFQHLIYPMLDDRTATSAPRHPFAGRHVVREASIRFGWQSYLGREPGGADTPFLAAPARCGDLSGLPPAYISTGALDLFVDENVDYATRLSRAGVPVELHLYPGAVHGFDLLPGTALAERARADSLAALARSLDPPRQGEWA